MTVQPRLAMPKNQNSDPCLHQQFEEVSLAYHNKVRACDRLTVNTSDKAFKALLQIWNMDQIDLVEHFKILLLDRNLKLMSFACISSGGTSSTVVDPKIIFTIALKRRANSIVLAHNHPSGDIHPSRADISMTKKIMAAADALDLGLMDHLVITRFGYFSFADENMLHRPNTSLTTNVSSDPALSMDGS